jgi:nucleoside-diphosphate-sugar epimerase/GT2 family glycosyltransferase
MRILVTGGAGFIGSHLVDRLILDHTAEVVVFDNFSRGKPEHLSQSLHRVRVVEGDVRHRALLMQWMSGVDLVYHLAAQSNVLGAVQDPDCCFETNVGGTYELLRAAMAAGVKRVIFSSSREVYGEPWSLPVPETAPIEPKNMYGASKAAGEMYCRSFFAQGLEVVIFRLANVYGPRDRDRVIPLFAKRAINQEALTVFGRNKILDFLWIHDLIDVLCKAARSGCPDTPVNLGSGKGTNLVVLAERVLSLTGRCAAIHITELRRPEVSRFIADVSAARNLYGLHCPADPIEHLTSVVEHLRRREVQCQPFRASNLESVPTGALRRGPALCSLKVSPPNVPKLIPLALVIPTRNRAPALRRTLESLAAQSTQPAQVIIVDGSENTATRCLCLETSIPGLISAVSWYAAKTVGAASQRNQGVRMCSQPAIGFIDDDVLFEPMCIAFLWRALDSDLRLGGVNAMITNQRYVSPGRMSRFVFRLMAGRVESTYAGRVLGPAVNLLPEDRDDLPEIVPVEWLNLGCTLYRREALPDPPFPGHFTGYSMMEDLTLSLTVGKRWKLANARTARIYHDSQGGSHKSDPGITAEMQVVNRYYVMKQVLGRTRLRDHLKLAVWMVFSDLSVLTQLCGWRTLVARLAGECRAIGLLMSRRGA